MTDFEIKQKGYGFYQKRVKNGGSSGLIYLPKSWEGKLVNIILTEPIDEKEEE